MTPTGLREYVAQQLQPVADPDPNVQDTIVDSVSPPSLVIVWSDPWLEPSGTCRYDARLTVLAVAGRVEPGAGIAKIEDLVAYVATRLEPWAATVSAPYRQTFGTEQIEYLASQIRYRIPVYLNGA
jgi:hypothetical protein